MFQRLFADRFRIGLTGLAVFMMVELPALAQNSFRTASIDGSRGGVSPTFRRRGPSLSESTAILEAAARTMYLRLEPGNDTPPNELLVYADLRVLRLYTGALEVAGWSLEDWQNELLRRQTPGPNRDGSDPHAEAALARYNASRETCRTLLYRIRLTAESVEHQATVCAPEVAREWREQVLPALRDTIAATESMPIPETSPWVDVEPAPNGNSLRVELVALGRQLFFDPRLSGDNRMSCASCHLPDKGFGDGLARARGHGGKTLSRNTPTLLDVGLNKSFFWDGRAASLEEQALMPIKSADEMNQDLTQLERELDSVSGYGVQFGKVFGTRVTREGIAKSIAAFERTLVTRNSQYDRYLAGDKTALSPDAKRGMDLFMGNAGCSVCHSGTSFSDGQFYRLGVSLNDDGLAAVTGKRSDTGKFRTPTLRNVAVTGPYMHDGSKRTLTEAVEFYYLGSNVNPPDDLPLDVEPLTDRRLSEVAQIVAFLESLTGEPPRVERPRLP